MKHFKRKPWEGLEIYDLKQRRDDRVVEVSAWLMVLLMLSVGVWSIWMIATH